MTKTFKDLIVWQKAKILAVLVYKFSQEFPDSEKFGLCSQMRRAAVSISSNIAESYHRSHTKEKNQFLWVAFGSGAELESQIEISKELYPKINYSQAEATLIEVMKILNNFLSK